MKNHFPGCSELYNWHVSVICKYLEEIKVCKKKRLIINMPPRHMKSMIVSVAWPAWLLGQNPRNNIIVASYSQRLSSKHSIDTRNIIRSSWYKNLFPDVEIVRDQNSKLKFNTTYNGFRMATSIGGTLTGEGGDFLILDDPMTPAQAASEKVRQNIIDWYEQTFATRLNDRKLGVIILVMHRLHVSDLSGYLISKPNNLWSHLNIPFQAEVDQEIYDFDHNVLYFRKKGSFIYDSMFDCTADLKNELGSYAFSAQYQQNPLLLQSGIIKKSWFNRYSNIPKECFVIQSWDTASSITGDYTVCTTWGHYNNNFYLMDVTRGQWDYIDLRKMVLAQWGNYSANIVLVENASSGQQIIQDLRATSQVSIVPITNKISKMARLERILPIIESGRVFLPNFSEWITEFECEVFLFPKSTNDDQIDSMTQCLYWADNRYKNKVGIRFL